MYLSLGPLWFPRWVRQQQTKPTDKHLWRHFCPNILLLAPPGAQGSLHIPVSNTMRDLKGPFLLWAESGGCGLSWSPLGSSKPGFLLSGEEDAKLGRRRGQGPGL